MNNDQIKNVRVLLVDDDEDDFIILKRLFSRIPHSPFQLEWKSTFDEALTSIETRQHDIYLIDYRLDGNTGLDILEKAHALERPEPFILLTGVGDTKIERRSLRLAASDYLVKSTLTSDTLSRALYYALGRKEIERTKIEQLVELNRSKEEFISIASHQLRTPATAVKQYLGMVVEGFAGDMSSKQKALLDKAYSNNERQLAIINDLLKVAQIDAGHTRFNKEKADIVKVLTGSIEDTRSMIEERRQTLSIDMPPVAMAMLDVELIRMVVGNLLDNASKYTPEGGMIALRLESVRDTWNICVSDTGVGVASPHRLFEKFSRIDNPLSTKVGGTGLGLYWAQSIARLHHGEITYVPNKPKGSLFTLTIPNDL